MHGRCVDPASECVSGTNLSRALCPYEHFVCLEAYIGIAGPYGPGLILEDGGGRAEHWSRRLPH